MDYQQIEKETEPYVHYLKEYRRALHRIPEIGFDEHKTHAFLYSHLEALKPDDLRCFAGTGIRAVFMGSGTGRTVAFRSDIDALPVTEATGCSFASETPGKMHACGHDGHMANLLTFAHWIADHRKQLADNVVLIFQPAEETTGGADPMIREGVLKNPDVDAIYGMHVMPDIPKGKIATKPGPIMAQTCEVDFVIHGAGAHGASPHMGKDSITALAHLLTLLQTTVARCVNPCEQALITIGKISAGTQRNIIADTAYADGIVRTFSNKVYAGLEKRIRQDVAAVDTAFETQTEFIKRVYYPCTENDPAEFERVKAAAGDRFIEAQARMTAEDFSYYQLEVPGVFVFCGVMDEQHHSPLHSNTFDFDEEALLPGLQLFAKLVRYTD